MEYFVSNNCKKFDKLEILKNKLENNLKEYDNLRIKLIKEKIKLSFGEFRYSTLNEDEKDKAMESYIFKNNVELKNNFSDVIKEKKDLDNNIFATTEYLINLSDFTKSYKSDFYNDILFIHNKMYPDNEYYLKTESTFEITDDVSNLFDGNTIYRTYYSVNDSKKNFERNYTSLDCPNSIKIKNDIFPFYKRNSRSKIYKYIGGNKKDILYIFPEIERYVIFLMNFMINNNLDEISIEDCEMLKNKFVDLSLNKMQKSM